MCILALPLGYLTDRVQKPLLLRVGVALGVASVSLQAAALFFRSVPLIYISSALQGATTAVTGPPLSALFADSIATGERTYYYTLMYSVSLAAGSLGPATAVVFFHFQGDEWSIGSLTAVMQAGNAISLLSFLTLLLVRDTDALGAASEGVLAAALREEHGEALLPASGAAAEEGEGDGEGGGAKGMGLGHQTCSLCGLFTLRVHHIPLLLFLSDITIALGAGATVAFFPLYFSIVHGIQPMGLSGIWATVPLLVAVMGLLLVPLSRVIGRAWAAVFANALGTTCLFALTVVTTRWGAIVTYVLRTAWMNSSYSIQRGILMDVVSKSNRGKWSSLANLTTATWAGSSLIGGWLVERYRFQTVFFGTACIYCVGLCFLVPVIALTKGEKVDKGGTNTEETGVN